MPVSPTYPGVYIEEVPSGVRTITGVATSITAFVGRAPRGPVDEPITINNFGDYERTFGGLALDSTLGYAVRDFYMNGGSQALIVRIERNAAAANLALSTDAGDPANNPLPLVAASAGSWGNNLTATVDYTTKDPGNSNLFNLIIAEAGGTIERHLNVSRDPADPRFLPRVLEQHSGLVRVRKDGGGAWIVPAVRPLATNPPTVPVATATGGADGDALTNAEYLGSLADKTGLYALEKADLFNLLVIPPPTREAGTASPVYQAALAYCAGRRAVLLVDPAPDWTKANAVASLNALGLTGPAARNAALYFPRIVSADPLRDSQPDSFAPSGAIAGIIARTDAQRGVWKAPAGIDAAINGIQALTINLSDAENGDLNPQGINCLRSFPGFGRVVWGARTLRGADQLADEYKYLPVRRLALFIEESLFRGTQWVVFEPNDEPLWAQIRLNVGAFMQNLFRQGAFQGTTPREAYFVKCDRETTTQNDINLGIVNILVGFAPLKPAEFVIVKLQQMAGQVTA